jgi:hypothetical protein
MPRSIQKILDHADELAQRFEDYEPAEGDERPVEEYLLQRAALARARSERQILDAVVAARAAGIPWAKIRRAARNLCAGRPATVRRRDRSHGDLTP